MARIVITAITWLVVASSTVSFAAEFTNGAVQRLWKPVSDEVYLQEIGEKILTSNAVTALAVREGVLYLVEGATLKQLAAEKVEEVPGAPRGIQRLKSLAGTLWASAESGTYRYASNSWDRVDTRPFQDFCLHLGKVYGATRDEIFRFDSGRFVSIRPAGRLPIE